MDKKKEMKMQQQQTTRTPRTPFPQKEKTHLLTVSINEDLFEACREEMKKEEMKFRQIIEWGLREYLIEKNRKKALSLGIIKE